MADTSLVFNLVARDRASAEVGAMAERFNTAATTIGAGFAAALGAGVMANLEMEAAGDKLAAQLGVGPAEAAELSKVAAGVYENAWGDSIATVNEAIRGVYKNIGDVSGAEGGLEGVTTKALALAETFDQDLNMATAAVGQLMRTGLADSADEAFDIITVGLQSAADKSGDYLETINEYSTQWRRVGVDGQTATGLLSQALKAGARDADQVADAIGIFGETALKGGTAVDTAYKSIGLSSKTVGKLMREGGTSAEKAFQMTMDALRGTKNETVRLNAAAALFGDPANIMGDSLYALDPATAAASAGMDKASGAADRMTAAVGDNPQAQLESFKRKVMGELGEAAGVIVKFGSENAAVMGPLMYTFAGLAATVLVVKAAMITYSAIATIVAGANALISASAWTVIGNWIRMNAVGLAAYARIAGAAVLSAGTTAGAWLGSALVSIGTWIAAVVRAAVVSSAQFLLMAGRAVIWALTMAAQWLIAMGPIGWVIAIVIALVALVIANWDRILAFTQQIWPMVWGAIKWIGQQIWNFFLNWTIVGLVIKHWDRIKTGSVRKATELVNWVRGLPGMIGRALGSLGNLLWGKGQELIRGLVAGVRSMGGFLKSSLMSFASSMVPGPIAKALGIRSPSRVMAEVVGRWIPAGIVEGIHDGQPQLARTMAELVQAPPSAAALATGHQLAPAGAPLLRGGGAGGMVIVRLDTTGGDSATRTFLQKLVRVEGRGSVQIAFGQNER
ncbi:phage tail tape measure protein [Streptomyces sp. NPDC008121]|uniref:phage tail tape measure protein n=1 Tax=Streptomyces sp. NPDC008121 TaxID=3364809 RepID=UPI0036ED99FB